MLLEEACKGDDAMRHEITSLLEADESAEETAGMQGEMGQFLRALNEDKDTSARVGHPADSAHIGPYLLLRKLGDGGMGAVYLATHSDKPYRKNVALKVLKRGMDSEDVLRRFRNERQILAALNHPNIAELIDGGITEDDRPSLVMSHVEDGRPIDKYCDYQQMPIEERLKLFQTVCHAVQYAHQNLVVHRDLKPGNILVSKDGTPHLLDFGIAKLLNPSMFQNSVAITRADMRLMTPEYASPEQVRGDSITTATDIYSLGVVLYQLLTGYSPYQLSTRADESMVQLICTRDPEKPSAAVRQDITRDSRRKETTSPSLDRGKTTPVADSNARATPIRRLSQQLKGDLDNIIMKALHKEPHRRYHSVGQFAEDIERYLNKLPVLAQRDTVGYRFRKFAGRHKVGVASMAAIFCIVLAFGLLMTIQSSHLADERDRAELALAKSETVSTFLMELLNVTNPFKAPGAPDTVDDLLKNGAERARSLSDLPEVQAQVLDLIGNVFLIRGETDEARPLLEKALELRRELFESEHAELATSLNSYALLHHYAGNYEVADGYYREALNMRQALFGDDHEDIARNLHELGNLLVHRGKYDESEKTLREGIAMRKRLGEKHQDLGVLLSDLGGLLRIVDREEEAAAVLQEALDLQRLLYDEKNHPEIARTIRQLGIVKREMGAYDEAEKLMLESLVMKRETFGEEHTDVANALNSLGALKKDMGMIKEAETLYRASLSMKRRLLGDDHVEVAPVLNNLAALLHANKDYEGAEVFYLEAFNIYRSSLGDAHRKTQLVESRLVSLYDAWGRPAHAARYRR